jgi:hypothetical protein
LGSSARARRLPSISTGSVESRWPAVSIRRSGRPRTLHIASIRSRVVPGVGATMARSSRSSALSRLDLPTFGSPTITASAPSCRMRPSGAVRMSWPICRARFLTRAAKFRPDARLDSLLREIEAGLEMAEQVDQLRAHRLERVAELALLHRAGAGQRAFGRRVEQVEQALRLRERKLVVEKGALGEFAGPRRARAEFEAGAHDASTMCGLPWHEISTVSSPV